MRKGILLAAAAALVTVPAQAANWVGPYSADGQCYYDASSVRRGTNGWMTVWTRCTNAPTFNILWQYACRDRMFRMLNNVDAVTGQQMSDFIGAGPWTYIPPESNADVLRFVVCGY